MSNSVDSSEDDLPEDKVPRTGELPQPPVVEYTRPRLKRGQYAVPDEQSVKTIEPSSISSVAKLGTGMSAGITFASSIIISVLIGMWLDKHFEPRSATPWWTIVFVVLGFVAGFMTFIRVSTASDKNNKR